METCSCRLPGNEENTREMPNPGQTSPCRGLTHGPSITQLLTPRLVLLNQKKNQFAKKHAHDLTLSHWLTLTIIFVLFSQENLQKLPLSIQYEQENFLISQGHVRNGKTAAHRSETVLLFTLLKRDKKQLLVSGSEKKIDFYL